MDLEAQIRQLAAEGNSRAATRQALGIPACKFRYLLTLMDPPVQWPGPNQSAVCRRLADARRGRQPEVLAARVRAEFSHTVRGVTGTLRELAAHFPECQVTANQVRKRMKGGMTLEQALFAPRLRA